MREIPNGAPVVAGPSFGLAARLVNLSRRLAAMLQVIVKRLDLLRIAAELRQGLGTPAIGVGAGGIDARRRLVGLHRLFIPLGAVQEQAVPGVGLRQKRAV